MSLSSRSWFRGLAATSAVVVLAVAGGAAALADNVVVDGDTVTGTQSSVSFGVPCGVPTTKTVNVFVTRQGTGQNTFANSAAVDITATSASPSVVVAIAPGAEGDVNLPPNWGDVANTTPSEMVTASITVTSTTEGDGSAVVTFSGRGLNVNNAPITRTATPGLTVSWSTGSCAPSNTPPSVDVTGVTDGGTYEYSDVPVAGCSVVDTEDGPDSFPAELSPISGVPVAGLGSQTATCEYTDAGGLQDTASATYTIVDLTPPTITFVGQSPASTTFGWNNSTVTLSWSCADTFGVAAGTVSQQLSSEGADQSATGTCTDTSGNTASDLQNGIDIDLTAPTVALVGGPADGASHYFGSVPAAPTCSASDALSGLAAECEVTGYATSVGTHTVTAQATDRAGNTSTASATYTVLAWTLNGFYQPVDMDKLNTVKSGSTVPLKFEVFAGDTELTETAVVQTFTTQQVSCGTTNALTDAIEVTTTGGTVLRYDATGGQFVQNWQTPKNKAGNCYTVTMTTDDGTSISADFQLK